MPDPAQNVVLAAIATLREELVVVEAPCSRGRLGERGVGVGRLAGEVQRGSLVEEQLGPLPFVDLLEQLEGLERLVVEARGLVVRGRVAGAIAGTLGVVDRLLHVPARGSLEPVVGELGQL